MTLMVSAQCQLIALLLAQGREPEAAKLLAQALEAAQGGALQAFQRLIEEQPQWLREQLAGRAACPVQRDLLTHLPQALVASTCTTEALSSREFAVLELIAQGCSNQQISERLFISLHTVKTHASHINSKLGVERRTQAVARAKSLGLLV
ncbi:hypothetical protein WR25_00949 [Diploscapter pachys]|uniref:HTH luxR-type domain-containing protein n=2 Tax=cellular organisms TaxID=131567 RepID=A0A2A2M5E0_9BILA|nr:hypothetical protein WR25_00949 [Diploscapter pachys]